MILVVAAISALWAAAALAAGGPARRRLALALGLLALALPFVVPGAGPLARFLAALAAGWGLVRLVDLVRERPPRALATRLWHVVAGFDTRSVRRVPSRLAAGALVHALGYAALAAAALFAVSRATAPLGTAARAALRWGGGALFVYATADAADGAVRAAYQLLGVGVPRIQALPIASRTIGELWGARWNRIVGGWLRAHVFIPMARRRRPGLGLLVAFGASAALHAYLLLAAAGPLMASVMAAFFVAQGLLVALERPLGVARWRPAAARSWVVVAMLATSPLFVEPMLRVVLPDVPPP